MQDVWVAGVDGCMGGWLAVFCPAGDAAQAEIAVVRDFTEVLNSPRLPQVIAVDMPIGLPDRTSHGGRGPELVLRPLLGGRQSSVFSIPSRAAVYAADYSGACETAMATSEPPRKVSKQAFHLFPKMREIDALLRRDDTLVRRIFRMSSGRGVPDDGWRSPHSSQKAEVQRLRAGPAERRHLLAAQGYPSVLLEGRPPRFAGRDDLLDGCAAAWTAARIAMGKALCWPNGKPVCDAFGLPIAIWT